MMGRLCATIVLFVLLCVAFYTASGQKKRMRKDEEIKIQGRIAGGRRPERGEYASLAVLRGDIPAERTKGHYNYQNVLTTVCGAVIIHSSWMLSAAHNFKNRKLPHWSTETRFWTAQYGKVDLWEDEVDPDLGDLENIIVHPLWEAEGQVGIFPNDIALVKLKHPLNIDRRLLDEAFLPNNRAEFDNWPPEDVMPPQCVFVGWGPYHPLGDPRYAADLPAPVRDGQFCHDALDLDFIGQSINEETTICAGYAPLNNNGSTKGDSGGPLFCKSPRYTFAPDTLVLAGITSFGLSFTTDDGSYKYTPNGFTRVRTYVDWILDTMRSN